MKRVCTIMIVACDLIAGAAPTQAADLIMRGPLAPAPIAAAPLDTSGWYLRGDIGYSFKSNTDGNWDFWNQYAVPYRGVDDSFKYNDFALKGGATFGAGIGYRFSPMFRVDATLDYFNSDIKGRTACPSYIKSSHGLNPVENNCNYQDSSKAGIWTAMANAYVDLPRLGPVQPYIGAGIGAANVSYNTWKTAEICPTCSYTSEKEGFSDWRFAMGLMAGVSYDITDRLKFDLGYRYLHINGGNAYGYDAADRASATGYGNGAGASGAQAKDNGFDIHTVRAGLRYEFR